MNAALLKAKTRASLIHLSLSLIIFAVALYLIVAIWYPGLLFTVDGGWQGVRIMVGVDLVLGPLLTLIVFNPGKPRREIATDLGLIALIQMAALCWGFWAVNHVKPLALSYHSGIVQSVIKEDIGPQEATAEDIRAFGNYPALVYARQPTTDEEKKGAVTFELVAGITPDKLVFLWEPLHDNIPALQFADRNDLAAKYPSKADAIQSLPGNLLRFYGRYGNGLLAINDKGEWVESLVLETE